MWKGIVKVQMPIMGHNLCLIYSEAKDVMEHMPISKDLKKAMGKEKKKYFKAYIRKDTMLVLDEEVEEQDF